MTWTTPDTPNGIILYYTVYCNVDESQGVGGILPPDVVLMVLVTYNSVIVTGLTPYTSYTCYVTARTSAGEGNSSMVVTAQTDESGKYLEKMYIHVLIILYYYRTRRCTKQL